MTEVISTNPATGDQRPLGFEESDDQAVLTATERAAGALDDYAGRPLA